MQHFGDVMTPVRTLQIVREEDFKKKKVVIYTFLCLEGFFIGLKYILISHLDMFFHYSI